MLRRVLSVFLLTLNILSFTFSQANGALAWRPIFDFDEAENKEKIFDLLLGELFFSADFGFKGKDVKDSTAGMVQLGDLPLYMAQGEIITTGGALDFAIAGEGFFQLEVAPGEYVYTRNGNFQIDAQGWVISQDGYRLYPYLRVDRADVPHLRMNELGRTLEITKSGATRDLYDFILFLPNVNPDGFAVESVGGSFRFSAGGEESRDFQIQHRSLELSTVKIERILARLSDILFRIKAENPDGNYEFRFYMIDHLLKSQLQMGQTAQSIKRFSEIVKGVSPLLLFDEGNSA